MASEGEEVEAEVIEAVEDPVEEEHLEPSETGITIATER